MKITRITGSLWEELSTLTSIINKLKSSSNLDQELNICDDFRQIFCLFSLSYDILGKKKKWVVK